MTAACRDTFVSYLGPWMLDVTVSIYIFIFRSIGPLCWVDCFMETVFRTFQPSLLAVAHDPVLERHLLDSSHFPQACHVAVYGLMWCPLWNWLHNWYQPEVGQYNCWSPTGKWCITICVISPDTYSDYGVSNNKWKRKLYSPLQVNETSSFVDNVTKFKYNVLINVLT